MNKLCAVTLTFFVVEHRHKLSFRVWLTVWTLCIGVVLCYSGLAVHAQATPIATFQSNARMVVIYVVARDESGRFLSGLTREEFKVVDNGRPQVVTSARQVNTVESLDPKSVPKIGRLSFCSIPWSPPFYYEVSYYPSKEVRRNGFHDISVSLTAGRAGTLSYRHGYFAFFDVEAPRSEQKEWQPDWKLAQAACNNVMPRTTRLLIVSGNELKIEDDDQKQVAAELNISVLSAQEKQDLAANFGADFAACALDVEGTPIRYFESRVEGTVEQQKSVFKNSVPFRVRIPFKPGTVSVRFALRMGERIGTVELPYHPSAPAPPANEGSLKYFGWAMPISDSLCGEVYPFTYPSDPSPKKAIGVLYTPFLDTPNQLEKHILPGIRGPQHLFGIDYFGTFWVEKPGLYRFKLVSDDGAFLYIDGVQVLNNGGMHEVSEVTGAAELSRGEHHIWVPYFQGAPVRVALQLYVAPPGNNTFRIMDLRDYAWPGIARQEFADISLSDKQSADESEWQQTREEGSERADARPEDVLAQQYCREVSRGIDYPEALSGACTSALSVFRTLPNVICDQKTERYDAEPSNSGLLRGTKLRDVVTTKVSYLHGKSTYAEIKINGQNSDVSPEKSGAWGTGDFGPILGIIFHPSHAAKFKFVREDKLNGAAALVYKFAIAQDRNTSWRISVPWSRATYDELEQRNSMLPGIIGEVWVEKNSHGILRTRIEATDLRDFPLRMVTTQSDYADIKLPDGSSLVLPTTSETDSCYVNSRACSHLFTSYRDCHKFAAKGRLILESEAPTQP